MDILAIFVAVVIFGSLGVDFGHFGVIWEIGIDVRAFWPFQLSLCQFWYCLDGILATCTTCLSGILVILGYLESIFDIFDIFKIWNLGIIWKIVWGSWSFNKAISIFSDIFIYIFGVIWKCYNFYVLFFYLKKIRFNEGIF